MTIFDKTTFKCRTFIEQINKLFTMGAELESEVDGFDSRIEAVEDTVSEIEDSITDIQTELNGKQDYSEYIRKIYYGYSYPPSSTLGEDGDIYVYIPN